MQEEPNRLPYGNRDLSDWAGRLNTNNRNPALTGFWIESSLLISPKEQTEVLARVFGEQTAYSPASLEALQQAMFQPELSDARCAIYGKTGMGKCDGVVVDAWFTGFAGDGEARRCFCVYLGEAEGQDVSSTRARKIAVRLLFPDSDETLRNKAQIDSYAVSKNSIAEPTGGHL